LKIPDERLQPPGCLGQLSDHPIVVRALVLDTSQKPLSLGRFPAGFGALLIDLGSQIGQVLLPRLQARLALGEALGSHTILSNQSSVHRGQRGEMPELHSLGDGIVTGEKNRERSTLGLELVEGPEPPLERLLLAEPLPTELADVRLEIADIRLGLPDPAVQRHHLLAPVRDPLVDGFELGKQPCFALLGVPLLWRSSLRRLSAEILLLLPMSAPSRLSDAGAPARASARAAVARPIIPHFAVRPVMGAASWPGAHQSRPAPPRRR
jgi:hypothetical protein